MNNYTQEAIKERFEANMLDGDKLENSQGTIISPKAAYEYLLQEFSSYQAWIVEEFKNRKMEPPYTEDKFKKTNPDKLTEGDISNALMIMKNLEQLEYRNGFNEGLEVAQSIVRGEHEIL